MPEPVYSAKPDPNEAQAVKKITFYTPVSLHYEVERRVSHAKTRDPDFNVSRLCRAALREYFRRHPA